MNNFDFTWFTTPSGLFITGGVILLLVALIILLVTGKNSRKEKKAQEANADNASLGASPVGNMNADPMASVVVTPVENQVSTVEAAPMAQPMPASVEAAPMAQPMPSPVDVAPMAQPMPAPITSSVEVMAPVISSQPAPAEVPTIVSPVEAQAAPAAAEPVIYGGASPSVPEFNVQPENHQIYGGADPLQNTQRIPTIAPVAPEPVAAEPVMTPAPAPEVAPVAPVQPVQPVAPVVPPQQ